MSVQVMEFDLAAAPKPERFAEGEDVSLTPEETAEVVQALDRLAEVVVRQGQSSASGGAEGGKGSSVEGGKGASTEGGKGSSTEGGKGAPADDGKGPVAEGIKRASVEEGKVSSVEGEAPSSASSSGTVQGQGSGEASSKEDEFDAFRLPPTAKPRSAEAFESLKKAAREVRDALKREIQELRQRLTEAEQALAEARKQAGEIPAEIQQELETLRKFRAAHDVEYDPQLRALLTRREEIVQRIYQKLQQAGVPAETIEKIKHLGGPEKVDWEPILPKLPSGVGRYVEARLGELEVLADEHESLRQRALTQSEQYRRELAERRAAEVWESVQKLLPNFSVLQPQEVPAGATEAQREAIVRANRDLTALLAQMRAWVSDLSPGQIAQLAVGTALAHRYLAALKQLDPALQEAQQRIQSLEQERDRLKQELATVTAKERPVQRAPAATTTSRPAEPNLLAMDTQEALEYWAKHVTTKDLQSG